VTGVVAEDVDERVANLGRRRELAGVEAIAPHLSASALEELVELFRERDDEPAHAGAERFRRVLHPGLDDSRGLDDEMEMIVLDRVLDDLEPARVAAAALSTQDDA
jgi:hypothetical protein